MDVLKALFWIGVAIFCYFGHSAEIEALSFFQSSVLILLVASLLSLLSIAKQCSNTTELTRETHEAINKMHDAIDDIHLIVKDKLQGPEEDW